MTHLLRCLLPALLLVTLAQAQQPAAVDEATVALFRFDGEVRDASPTELPATLSGTAAYAEGRFGQALVLDGKSGLVFPPSGALHLGEQSWTLEFWCRPDPATAGDQPLYATGWGLGQLTLRLSGRRLVVHPISTAGQTPLTPDATDAGLHDGQWHHVALVIDRARRGELRLYVDGQRLAAQPAYLAPLVFEAQAMGACVGAVAPWYIGKQPGFVGAIDELRLSNVVRPEYASTEPPPPAPPAPRPFTFTYDAADSATPLTLAPETTLIVVPSIPVESRVHAAAKLLQTWLRRTSLDPDPNFGYDIVTEDRVPSIAGKAILALGPTRWLPADATAGLGPDGYVIRRLANVVLIAGEQSTGTWHGVLRFLDRQLGVRFYLPTPLWVSAPPAGAPVLPALDLREVPFARTAYFSGLTAIPGDYGWADHNAVLRRRGGTHQHSFNQVFPPERFAATMPEIYPILKGQRYVPTTPNDQEWAPCFSEPRLLDAALLTAQRTFRQSPALDYLAFSILDSHAMCECPRCLSAYAPAEQADPKEGRVRAHSALYWAFMTRLAERFATAFPGKRLVGLSYATTRFPPAERLPANITVVANFHIAELDADHILTPRPDGTPAALDAWLAKCHQFGNHDWYQGQGYLLPRVYTGYWSQFLRTLQRETPAGTFQHVECYPNWGLDGPKYWLLARLLWNPQEDPQALLQQFAADLFGPAAPPMVRYFQELEALWTDLDNRKGPERKLFRWQTQFRTDADDRARLARCRQALDEAATLVTTDEQRQRLALFSETFRLTETCCEFAAATSVAPARLKEAQDHAQRLVIEYPLSLHGAATTSGEVARTVQQVLLGLASKAPAP